MTKREAAIVAAYTGFFIGDLSEMHKYIEEKFGRPVLTHEMASKEFQAKLKQKTKDDFCVIVIND